jgi:hypothetical protein
MFLFRIIFLTALVAASAASSEPLADMHGTWKGSGWARDTQQGPQETVRCQITNNYDSSVFTLTLSGQCVVPGRRLTVSGTLTGSEGPERITGRWSNPDGIGSVRIVGVQRDGIVAFNFSATDPATGRDLSQNVEWRVSEGALRLRSSDRRNPDIMMSDISFSQ